jgi:hypothetical protein
MPLYRLKPSSGAIYDIRAKFRLQRHTEIEEPLFFPSTCLAFVFSRDYQKIRIVKDGGKVE